ncbi:iron-sulfur cluster assembly scaffold protein [Pyruvatibacter mobilis]|uniref:Iron-sulfur cluster assembly scaffold protein n=1 Tax=Pyruvatibacter mobilis TaxID=1712261 RepID=A0A845QEJ4_9HYPH|nr:iron-sulfur cluster assembly scaffold protein [Pyruvatibacter mobilis]NBG96867.1 iron-sulfur cluster assembly scaffold protein [Pyruvatibacter mobilis]QJD74753.1 iron-sulfur cluster assembly scaffold protein [Pyruvatibacter mobilis]GGD09817.1 iron-sulfur cluster assembly scaffold protein [Pyruvatibacter mobilis]
MSDTASQSASGTDLNDVYNARILELAGNIPRIGKLEDAAASASAISKMCGSKVTVHLKMADGRVSDFAHEVHACALGQASSSVMARHVIGATRADIEQVRDQMRAMLKEEGDPPTGDWADLEVLLPARDFKNRHQSIMLTFEATLDAISQIEAAADEV